MFSNYKVVYFSAGFQATSQCESYGLKQKAHEYRRLSAMIKEIGRQAAEYGGVKGVDNNAGVGETTASAEATQEATRNDSGDEHVE